MTIITTNKVVSFRYIMRNEKAEVLEDTMDGAATIYLHGGDSIQPYLQNQLNGLITGDKKIICLDKNSGLTDNAFTFEVIIDQVRDALPEELILGYPVQLDSERCEEYCECYHQL